MNLSLQVKQAMETVGGATESIFPHVEAWLLADADRQHALEFVAARKNMDRYESVMDFLFCEIFTEFKSPCFKYYDRAGNPLRDFISADAVIDYSVVMLKALAYAYVLFCDGRAVSWKQFRADALALAA